MNRRFVALGASLALAASLFAGCSSEETPAASSTTAAAAITVVDQTGRTVTLAAPATAVVGITASDIEILYAIGAGNTVVGRGEYANYPPEVLDVTVVNSGNDTNIEEILALKPQLVIMSTMAQNEEQISKLEAGGVQVFVTDAESIGETYESIQLIGKLMGKDAEAAAVVSKMETTLATLHTNATAKAATPHKTIYFEVSPLEYGLWAAGNNTFMNEVAELLELDNIFADLDGWNAVSQEQIIERNPDYILTVGMYFGDGPTPIESILSREGWANLNAIQNSAIINLTADELSRPGPRIADGAQLLYDFVYGE
jgi:iron complex transport system substrate-binding protein